jgi:hypothetical protein
MQQQQGSAKPPQDDLFTPEEIVAALGSPIDHVREQWPLVASALAEFGILDRPTAIAAIATIGVEAHTFFPIEEYLYADGSIPGYWHGYGGGAEYHGRGLIQLTHDYNYRHYGDALGVDLVANPSLALDSRISARVLALYFLEHGIHEMAGRGEWIAIRRAVNGGYSGLGEYQRYVNALA